MNEETKIVLKISKFIQRYQQTIEAIYQCRASTINRRFDKLFNKFFHKPKFIASKHPSSSSPLRKSGKSLDTTRPFAQDLLESI